MPFARGGQRSLGLQEGYYAHEAQKRAKRDQELQEQERRDVAAYRRHQMLLGEAQNARSQQRHGMEEAAHKQDLEFGAQRLANEKQRGTMQRGAFEHDRLAESRARREQQEMAATGARIAKFGFDAYTRAHPELEADAAEAAKILEDPNIPEKARAAGYAQSHQLLQQRAEELGQQKIQNEWKDMLQMSALTGNPLDGPELAGVQAAIDDPNMPYSRKAQIAQAFMVKSAKQKAEAMNVQAGSMQLQQMTDGLGAQPGSPEYGAALRANEAFKAGLLSFAQAQEQIEGLRAKPGGAPKVQDQIEIAKAMVAGDLSGAITFEQAFQRAGSLLNPQPGQTQPQQPIDYSKLDAPSGPSMPPENEGQKERRLRGGLRKEGYKLGQKKDPAAIAAEIKAKGGTFEDFQKAMGQQ